MSTEQKHTPGPWRVVPIGSERYVESDSYHPFICDMQRNECPNESTVAQCDANARLIAAAPELLEACIAALHAVDVALCGTPGAHYFNAVKTALKKANATTIEDNLALNVTEIKAACEKARGTIAQAIAKAINP